MRHRDGWIGVVIALALAFAPGCPGDDDDDVTGDDDTTG